MILAYIGLGNMGYIIAGHIADKLKQDGEPTLLVYNRSNAKVDALIADGKHVQSASIDHIARHADIIFTCMFNDEASKQIIGKDMIGSGQMKHGAIIVEQATIRPDTAEFLASIANEKGLHYLTCPVMGAPPRATAKLLVPLLAGNPAQRKIVRPYLENVIGKVVVEVGDSPGSALRLKLCGNYIIVTMVEMIAEALTLGEASGVGQNKVQELLAGLFAGTPVTDYAQRMTDETYDDVRFSLDGANKDTTYILDLAEKSNADIPMAKVFKNHLDKLTSDYPSLDISGVVGVVREASGLPFNLKKA
ncbi:NAD(P)-binding protein [Hesseltinella vesiculosa]|uniref:NAD(P)-binding protein n=1 Tax=Hesseltinella vesiculosa TaxID=101127 RepID=A0A1X2G7B5_9FUNG|nr:NAD(P)-binding protein [Hesseltinella vesiculosa]